MIKGASNIQLHTIFNFVLDYTIAMYIFYVISYPLMWLSILTDKLVMKDRFKC